jgi:hypothetical protein
MERGALEQIAPGAFKLAAIIGNGTIRRTTPLHSRRNVNGTIDNVVSYGETCCCVWASLRVGIRLGGSETVILLRTEEIKVHPTLAYFCRKSTVWHRGFSNPTLV